MSFEQTKWIWHNGQNIPFDEAKIHLSAYGLHYGTGVFEGMRAYATTDGPAIFRNDEHLDRLYASAAVYGMDVPFTKDELTKAICDNIGVNGFESCYLRPLVFFDAGGLGIRAECPVSVTIIAWPWSNDRNSEKYTAGVRATISPWTKFHSSMMPTTAKSTGQYLNAILAVKEADRRGYDEAILLDVNGDIAEGAVENLFLVKDGRLVTNDEKSSILLGITRASTIEIARDLGYEVEIRTMRPDDLMNADEAFFTGTAIEIQPIRSVDDQPVGSDTRGPVTRQIQQAYFDIVAGRNPKYQHWLHPVHQFAMTPG
ncbi:MAG TPA: branched-chain amino acid transaminase [Blastocatellia bacterium]|nr:branched-chain amino acid transaminase [Blastocatellia bacterium]